MPLRLQSRVGFLFLTILLLFDAALSQQCSATNHCAVGCCSQWGSCGFGPDFCGAGCQSTCDAEPDCSATKLCETGCCGQFGSCGFGPEFCGTGCQSTCDAEPQCSPTKPCESGCCNQWGNCGFGPEFCGAGCQNNCDAVADCGEYAAPGKSTCPLNVCCSPHGFCGTTDEFCGDGCQNGCSNIPPASCSGGTSDKKTIGYYESWSTTRPCDAWYPEDLNVELLTHINFAFALVGPDNKIATANAYDIDLYRRTTNLKARNPRLRVYIAVGGWAAGTADFSRMASTAGGRSTFISSVLAFMKTYGFDGIDLDWEYPSADDRGGVAADMANYVSLVSEMRATFGQRYGITVAVPNSYWYLRGFDVAGMIEHIDWFNVMSYDIHGTWDGNSKWTQPLALPHSNISEIRDGLNLLWRNNVPRHKVVLGLAFYGRSFTLKSASCNTPGCEFRSGAEPGPCTGTSGVLSNNEIFSIIQEKGLTPVFDQEAGVKYINWDGDQWVSYDDWETFALKKAFANSECLGGTMIWALDLDAFDHRSLWGVGGSFEGYGAAYKEGGAVGGPPPSKGLIQANNLAKKADNQQTIIGLVSPQQTQSSRSGLFATNVGGVSKISGAIRNTCDPGKFRIMCIEDNVDPHGCIWYGMPPSCNSQCPAGSILLFKGSDWINGFARVWGWSSGLTCRNSYSFCCERIDIAPNELGQCELNGNISPYFGAPGGGYSGDSHIARRRVAQLQELHPAPLPSGYVSPEECQYQRGSLQVMGSPLNGGSWIYQLPGQWINNPGGNGLPALFVPHGKPGPGGLNLPPQQVGANCVTITQTFDTTRYYAVETKVCDGNNYQQACYHMQSVMTHSLGLAPGATITLTCPATRWAGNRRWAPGLWDAMHHRAWLSWIPRLPANQGLWCERDEFPYFAFIGEPGFSWQYIRLIPKTHNAGAGQLANGFCPMFAETTIETTINTLNGRNGQLTCWETVDRTTSLKRMFVENINIPDHNGNQGLALNPCLPTITNDPGYALYTDDRYYARNGLGYPPYWWAPAPSLTVGHVKPVPNAGFIDGFGKRDGDNLIEFPADQEQPPAGAPPIRNPLGLRPFPPVGGNRKKRSANHQGNDNDNSFKNDEFNLPEHSYLAVVLELARRAATDHTPDWRAAALGFGISDGNRTRAPTRAELLQQFGVLRCASENCERELDAVGRDERGNYKLRSGPVAYETVTGAATAAETGGPAQQAAASLCATATVAASTESGGGAAETRAGRPGRGRGRHDRRAYDEYYQPHAPTHAPVVTFENRG
ncbi:hypothetical protein CHGG_03486 [Chaetomium globosum CBS 148.51]|uniref:chitinase n=1 Tax=Chaetomium globosum (strain ATCC 6205 / CBS 148.51 / DSM 1962 / NBRC 6347 / NRRL 1970) TaxID=306901 RepID=Q2H8G8_CHAGB|nr:uncharacterized protein CHGG_03486 [Chaetomium globosum CBS 148.51]EAQ91551.1 hypothetical protein CHGG_03486 [Chaetomium globosum CBS 148.51]